MPSSVEKYGVHERHGQLIESSEDQFSSESGVEPIDDGSKQKKRQPDQREADRFAPDPNRTQIIFNVDDDDDYDEIYASEIGLTWVDHSSDSDFTIEFHHVDGDGHAVNVGDDHEAGLEDGGEEDQDVAADIDSEEEDAEVDHGDVWTMQGCVAFEPCLRQLTTMGDL